uniref:ATP synthase complex subunit 8 n=1 Tax=Sapayoa aenigma TaxID=239371 RepID=A0A7L8D9X0_9TYRA|nr:ATP synthase F0 subunit 8 [Sapayoa aenigma]QOD96944.1 ATP synthase F0 subunit 8 [Sapayoa aenigma]
MPQLNPYPWFFIMLTSWITYSTILQPKLLPFTLTNPPTTKPMATPKPSSWNWPWT